MEPRHRHILHRLKFRNQLRFLIYLYWLKLEESLEWIRSRRSKIHWIGGRTRPRRLERAFFITVIFAAMLTFDPHQYVVWATIWGTFFAFTINFYLVLRLLPRKSYQRDWEEPL